MKRLHVVIPDELHRRVGARAKLSGETIGEWVTKHVLAAVEQEEAEAAQRQKPSD